VGEQYVREEIDRMALLLQIMTFCLCDLLGFHIYRVTNISQICRPRIGRAYCRCQFEYKLWNPGLFSTGFHSIKWL